MSANFTPEKGDFTPLKPFRFWCQKVLPLVYDDSLSYYELLCKVVDYLNKSMEDTEHLNDDVTNMFTAFGQLQDYVNRYFDTIDVSEEINDKLDAMAIDGSLAAIMAPTVGATAATEVSEWLAEHITPTTPAVDSSLSVSGAAADAKVTGDKIGELNAGKLNYYWSRKHLLIQGAYDYKGDWISSATTVTCESIIVLKKGDFLKIPADTNPAIGHGLVVWNDRDMDYDTMIRQDANPIFTEEIYYAEEDVYIYLAIVKSPLGNISPSDCSILPVSYLGVLENDGYSYEYENLFDPFANNLYNEYKLESTGQTLVNTAVGQTDYIAIDDEHIYSGTFQDGIIEFYDEDKQHILEVTSAQNPRGVVLPPIGAKYARFLMSMSALYDYKVHKIDGDYMQKTRHDIKNFFDHKKCVIFGTSITYRGLTAGGASYVGAFNAMSKMIIDNQGLGTGMLYPAGGRPDIYNAIINYQSYSDKDVCIIEGFPNDFGYQSAVGNITDEVTTSICGRLRLAIKHILTQKPTIRVFIVLDHYGRNYGGVDSSSTAVINGRTQYEFYSILEECANSIGIPVIPIYKIGGISEATPDYLADNIHLSASGGIKFATAMWNAMCALAENTPTR